MIILDKQCKDIFLKHCLNNTIVGRQLKTSYDNKDINKEEFLETLNSLAESFLGNESLHEVEQILTREPFFIFNVKKQIEKITDDTPVAILTEPMLIKRHVEEDFYFSLEAEIKSGDMVMKRLPLEPERFQDLLDEIEVHGFYVAGMNWAKTKDAPSVIIFGYEQDVKETKERLINSYEL